MVVKEHVPVTRWVCHGMPEHGERLSEALAMWAGKGASE